MSPFRSFALLCLLPVSAQAQSPSSAGDAIGVSFGVAWHDGVPIAGGPRYSVSFLPSGPVYAPLLGREAQAVEPGPVDLQFSFVEAQVGGQVLARGGAVAPQVEGSLVSYAHGAVVETYEVRHDGVKQSFVLAERPAAAGDLVVRGRIGTALPLVVASDEEVRFALPCGAGVSFGAVLGVDRDGRTMRGSMRCFGDQLELSLPAAFVQSASYPLVLDPLVGTAFAVGDDPLYADVEPAVAYDESNARYLVVWAVSVPATSSSPAHRQIRGQFVAVGGGVQGQQLLLTVNAADNARPALANVNATNRFLVAWKGTDPVSSSGGVIVRSVSASNAAMSNFVVASASSLLVSHDETVAVGGDLRTGLAAGQRALLAYRSVSSFTTTSNTIQVRRVLVPSTGDPVVEAPVSVASTTSLLDDVAVSPHCGTAGRWLVVVGQSVVTGSPTMTRLFAQVVDDSGVLCGTPETVVNTGSGDVRSPSVATRDGSEFVVAWEDAAASTVKLRRGVVGGACGSTNWAWDGILVPIVQAGAAKSPAIVFARDRYLLAWQQNARVFVKALEPATCASCGLESRVDANLVLDAQPALASRWDGGDTTTEGAMAVWAGLPAISARHWVEHATPGIENLGGGCGIPGLSDFATYDNQPVLGADDFEVLLLNPTSPVLAMVIGFSENPFACGPCTLIPSQDVIVPGLVSATIPIPCNPDLIRAELFVQWVQVRPSGCPAFAGYGVSNCLKFTIAE
ncbi:MAG: hypothetical protein JNL12_18745 [Planctomycetes bacterium]|nr:hypothetical protein [Planctomycetota bacterium]